MDWADIDFPEVVELRNSNVPPLPNVRAVAADATDITSWLANMNWHEGRAVMVLAEGVSMYLDPERAKGWLRGLVEVASERSSILFLALDLASPLMVRQSQLHPSVSQTGATFTWGVRHPADVSKEVPKLQLIDIYDVARQCGPASRVVAAAYRILTGGRPVYSCALFRSG